MQTTINSPTINLLTFDNQGVEKTSIKVHSSNSDISSYVEVTKQQIFESALDEIYSHWFDIDSCSNFHESRNYSDEIVIDYSPVTHCSFNQMIWEIRKGLWSLKVSRNLLENVFNFSIRVAIGRGENGQIYYSDHPLAIQEFLSERFSPEIYNAWSNLVWDDIDSLEDIVNLSRVKISSVIPSVVSHYRSELLLDLVDIPVEKGIAFLIPSKLGG